MKIDMHGFDFRGRSAPGELLRQSSGSLAGRVERVAVVYPGSKRYPLSVNVEVVPLAHLAEPDSLFPDA